MFCVHKLIVSKHSIMLLASYNFVELHMRPKTETNSASISHRRHFVLTKQRAIVVWSNGYHASLQSFITSNIPSHNPFMPFRLFLFSRLEFRFSRSFIHYMIRYSNCTTAYETAHYCDTFRSDKSEISL